MSKNKKLATLLLSFILVCTCFVSFTIKTLAGPPIPTLSISVPCTRLNVGYNVAVIVSAYGITSDISYTSSNPSCADVNDSGVISTLAEGTATITASCIQNGTTYSSSVSITVTDCLGLNSGSAYRLINYGTQTCLERTGSALYDAGWSSSTQSWIYTVYSDGLAVLSSGSSAITATATAVTATTNTAALSQKFTIYRIGINSQYAGLYVICSGTGYLSMNSNGDIQIVQTLGPSCYWSFVNASFGNAAAVGYRYTDYNTTPNLQTFSNTLDTTYSVQTYTNVNSVNVFNLIQNTQVLLYRGHGLAASLWTKNSSGTTTGVIAATSEVYPYDTLNRREIEDLSRNALKSSRCILYMACRTGSTYVEDENDTTGPNLIKETFLKGAHFVLGTTGSTLSSSNTAWIDKFLSYLEDGSMNIEDAIFYTNQTCTIKVEISEDVFVEVDYVPLYYIGDTTQYLDQ